jgi:hypothetical protein
MRRSLPVRCGLRLGLSTIAWVAALLGGAATAAAQDRSPIVLNCDGNGTTVVKEFPDSSFQVQQLWTNNSVNGIQAFTDGTFAFVNCTPTLRTLQELDLSCRVFDQTLGSWGEPPITTTVPADFLDGDFANPYNSLFESTGEYLTVFDVGSQSYGFRLRFLDAVLAPSGAPVLIGETSPEARAFMLRTVDVTGGTSKTTNISVGLQFDDLCADFDLNPTAPGGTLVGTFGARELNADGSCGDVVVADRSAALVPSGSVGQGGAGCPYRVLEVGECSPLAPFQVGSTICLPCGGTCREFDDDIDIVLQNSFTSASAYVDCRDVVVEPSEGDAFQCSQECEDGLPAIFFTPGSDQASPLVEWTATLAAERTR